MTHWGEHTSLAKCQQIRLRLRVVSRDQIDGRLFGYGTSESLLDDDHAVHKCGLTVERTPHRHNLDKAVSARVRNIPWIIICVSAKTRKATDNWICHERY